MDHAVHNSSWHFEGVEPARMICFVAATILVYDHLSTLEQEINLIWKRRLGNFATLLFIVNRYSPYVHVSSILGEYWFIASTQKTCFSWDIANSVFLFISITTCELILALRTWAMWGLSRRALYFFTLVACIKVPVVTTALAYLLLDAHYIRISDSPEKIICISPVMGDWSWETLVFVVIVMTETAIASLTLVKAIEARHSASQWYFRIHYMGIIYYFFILGLTILNLVGTLYLRNIGTMPFAVLQGVLQAALCNRVMFLAHQPSEFSITSLTDMGKSTFALSAFKAEEGVTEFDLCSNRSS